MGDVLQQVRGSDGGGGVPFVGCEELIVGPACSGKVTSGVARPFGEGVTLDGVDLDIEMTATGDGQSNQLYYDSFASTLKGLDSGLIVSA